jgi:mono/diheme cytochrome c family protein
MAEGKSRHDWGLMSSLLAHLANCHGSRSEGYSPREFDPWALQDAPEVDIADVAFGGNGKG